VTIRQSDGGSADGSYDDRLTFVSQAARRPLRELIRSDRRAPWQELRVGRSSPSLRGGATRRSTAVAHVVPRGHKLSDLLIKHG